MQLIVSLFKFKLNRVSWVLIAFLAQGTLAIPESKGASFDCNIASRPIEKTICSDNELSALDEKLNRSYQAALTQNPDIKFSQRDWLKALNQCNNDNQPTTCLRNAFKARIQALNLTANPSVGTLGMEILGLYRINNQNGLQVGHVTPNGSGYNAGILPGDFIVEINNAKIDDVNQAMNQLSIPPGQAVLLKLVKKDNSERVIQVKMGSKADIAGQTITENTNNSTPAPENQIQPNAPAPDQASEESKISMQKANSKEHSSEGGSSTWLVILLLAIIGIVYYRKKQKKSAQHPEQQVARKSPENTKPKPRKSSPTTEDQPIEKDRPKQNLSRDELLKQQQLNAFKKLK